MQQIIYRANKTRKLLPRLKPGESVSIHKTGGYKRVAKKSMAVRKHPKIYARSEK